MWPCTMQVLSGKRFKAVAAPALEIHSWMLAARTMKHMTAAASSVVLYLSLGLWAHLFMSLVTAPIIGCVLLLRSSLH